MASLKDIAKTLGVSPSAVSLVLNGKAKQKRISDDLIEKITATAASMGYHPNRVAVSLRTGKSKTIGLIVENISDHFFSTLAKIIEDEARKYGYNVVYCSIENDAAKGREMIQMLYDQQVDSYIMTPANGMEGDIKKLQDQNKPVVLMDRYFTDLKVPFVVVDNFTGMKKGMEHLLMNGASKIGFITVDLDLLQMKDRERAYKDALQQHELPFRKANILKVPYNFNKSKAVDVISTFLEQKKFDAVVFATNYLGIYGLQSIKSLRLKIPEDISVICFDDHDIFDLHSPGITAIRQPIEEIAKKAVSILIGELGHQKISKQQQVSLSTELVIRGSV